MCLCPPVDAGDMGPMVSLLMVCPGRVHLDCASGFGACCLLPAAHSEHVSWSLEDGLSNGSALKMLCLAMVSNILGGARFSARYHAAN